MPTQYTFNNGQFRIVSSLRRMSGLVLRSAVGDPPHYARLGPRETIARERIYQQSLSQRGFPVPDVIAAGNYDEEHDYFIESSAGDEPFHVTFTRETQELGAVQEATFQAYLGIMERYVSAQMNAANRVYISPQDFVRAIIPLDDMLRDYANAGHDARDCQAALEKATRRLELAAMGYVQYDLNPFNVLPNGIIDFELVGYGPAGFDGMMSVRWADRWYPNYPALYTKAYRLSQSQIARSDSMIDSLANANGLIVPSAFLQEFLFIKCLWALAYFDAHDPRPYTDWPVAKQRFQRYRANIAANAVKSYLNNEPIRDWQFSNIPGGEI